MKLLNEDRDAARWAREFIQLWGGHKVGSPDVGEGLMIAWFANAMMCGEDTYRWRKEKEAASPSEADQRDATRYRWLREHGYKAELTYGYAAIGLDSAIDAAMRQSDKEESFPVLDTAKR